MIVAYSIRDFFAFAISLSIPDNTVFMSIPLLQGSVTLAAKLIQKSPETMFSTQTDEILVLNVLKAEGLCQKKFNKRFNGMSQFIRNRIHVACLRAF